MFNIIYRLTPFAKVFQIDAKLQIILLTKPNNPTYDGYKSVTFCDGLKRILSNLS